MYSHFDLNVTNASFEWDEHKDAENFRKHGIHFKTAARVFLDPDKLIRIISARIASVSEKERYKNGEDEF